MESQIFLLQYAPTTVNSGAPFYVIEKFPDPQFVLDEDGNVKSFENYEDALNEAEDCQDGYVISFGID
jgi:hypothetical protein